METLIDTGIRTKALLELEDEAILEGNRQVYKGDDGLVFSGSKPLTRRWVIDCFPLNS